MLSCNSSKEIRKTENKSDINKTDLIKQGYELGTVHYNENSFCDYTIILQETGFHLDPVNFNDDRFNAFREQGKNVIFKYLPLRRTNRCNNIQPVELSDIKIIE